MNTANMSREEWLGIRKKSITGTDIGAIMGFNPYKSALQVYNEKMGIVEPPDISNKEAVYFGIELEDFVAKEFTKRTGKKVRRCNKMLQHPEYAYLRGSIDRNVVGENSVLECKTTSAYNVSEWKDDQIPDQYILQTLFYMLVGGYDTAYVAVLLGGQKFLWREINKNEVKPLLESIEQVAISFWEDNILAQVPPQATALDNKNFADQEQDDEEIELPPDTSGLIVRLENIKSSIKALDEEKNGIEAQIKQYMSGHKKATVDRYKISWNISTYKTFDTKRFKEDQAELAERYMKESKRDNGLRLKVVQI